MLWCMALTQAYIEDFQTEAREYSFLRAIMNSCIGGAAAMALL